MLPIMRGYCWKVQDVSAYVRCAIIPTDPQRGLAEPVTDSLYRITGGDSNGLTYVSVWQLLIDHAAAGEEIAEKEPPF